MKPSIPYGGFLVSQSVSSVQSDLIQKMKQDSRVKHIAFSESGVVLACWSQFRGQGLWREDAGAIVYDVALTNQRILCKDVGVPLDADLGNLLFVLFRKYGPDFCDKLRGAFAFALWDNRSLELLVVTDCYGIRPVVTMQRSDLFAAASRIRQLELVGFEKSLNPEAIYHYLFFQAVCSPISIYKNVQKLEAGKSLTVVDGKANERTWYDLAYKTLAGRSEEEWSHEIRRHVAEAVQHYIPQEKAGTTGCFLSGGTDSSSIVGFASKQSTEPVKTFSIGFDDPKYNELGFARIAAKHFRTDQYEYMVTPEDVLQLISYLPKIYDEPFGNASVIAAYFCAGLAKENEVELMLGGDGGDEIFGGNERYVTNLIFQRYANSSVIFRQGFFEPLLNLMPSSGVFYKAKRYVRRANIANPRRFYSYNLLAENDNAEIFQPDFLATVDTDCFFQRAQKLYDRAAPASDTDRLMYIDMKNTITDNDLRKVTQMVEAAGIQVEYPLLDRNLVDFTCTIPADIKVKPGKNRYIFKKAMQGFLPDEIIFKSKHGMGLPIAKWLRNDKELNGRIEDTLFSGSAKLNSFIRQDYLMRLKNKLYSEETPYYGDNLWVFLILEDWVNENNVLG